MKPPTPAVFRDQPTSTPPSVPRGTRKTFGSTLNLACALGLLGGSLTLTPRLAAQDALTVPVGVMAVTINAGTVSAPVTTSFSISLLEIPQSAGATATRVTSLTATTLTATAPQWVAGGLSNIAAPYALRFTSGAAIGRTYGISTTTQNTVDTITIEAGTDLTTLSIVTGSAGDTFEIIPIDTLNTLFGSNTLLGGATASSADIVTLMSGSKSFFYYNTTLLRWVRTSGPTSDRGNVSIPLNSAISITRKSTAFQLAILGRVPSVLHTHVVANAGSTFTNTGFPATVTIGALAIQSKIPGWVSNATSGAADWLIVSNGITTTNYFFNGTNWLRTTGPSSVRDDNTIDAGNYISIFKRGVVSGTSLYTNAVPYSLTQ